MSQSKINIAKSSRPRPAPLEARAAHEILKGNPDSRLLTGPVSNGVKLIPGGITAPRGFTANSLYCGIKQKKKKDLVLIYSEKICEAAGVFTTNKIQASCVVINRRHLVDGKAQAIIANSGNANCMTGKRGFEDSKNVISYVSQALRLPHSHVLVASTGIIGKMLPIEKIRIAIPMLIDGLSKKGSKNAATGILTTDRLSKEASAEIKIGKRNVRIGVIAKGAGMIHPQMKSAGKLHATMLCFATTDAVISSSTLQSALDEAVEKTFNMITIDGDMSTNDMVLVLANGMAKNKKIANGSEEFQIFRETLEQLFLSMAKLMVHDAEGATKFVEVAVSGAASEKDAREVARSVASSNLFKCAVHGSDPNWGRIAAAVGYSDARVDAWKLQIYLGHELVLKNGGPVKKDIAVLNRVLAKKEIRIMVDLGLGSFGATAYTCDFSPEYVRINSAYRT